MTSPRKPVRRRLLRLPASMESLAREQAPEIELR